MKIVFLSDQDHRRPHISSISIDDFFGASQDDLGAGAINVPMSDGHAEFVIVRSGAAIVRDGSSTQLWR
jgi:hypothetical protein